MEAVHSPLVALATVFVGGLVAGATGASVGGAVGASEAGADGASVGTGVGASEAGTVGVSEGGGLGPSKTGGDEASVGIGVGVSEAGGCASGSVDGGLGASQADAVGAAVGGRVGDAVAGAVTGGTGPSVAGAGKSPNEPAALLRVGADGASGVPAGDPVVAPACGGAGNAVGAGVSTTGAGAAGIGCGTASGGPFWSLPVAKIGACSRCISACVSGDNVGSASEKQPLPFSSQPQATCPWKRDWNLRHERMLFCSVPQTCTGAVCVTPYEALSVLWGAADASRRSQFLASCHMLSVQLQAGRTTMFCC